MSAYQQGAVVLFQPWPGSNWVRGTYQRPVVDRRAGAVWHYIARQDGIAVRVPNRRIKAAPPMARVHVAVVQIEGSSDAVTELASLLADALSPKKDTP